MNDIDLVILSIVAESSRFGHEVQQIIESRDLRKWIPIGFSSVYYVLAQLEKEGLVTGDFPEEDLRTARKRYEATEAGLAVLRTAVMDILIHAQAGLGTFELGLLTASALPPDQVQDALYQRRIELARQLKTTEAALTHPNDADRFDTSDLLKQRAIRILELDLDWLSHFEQQWEDYHFGAGENG